MFTTWAVASASVVADAYYPADGTFPSEHLGAP